MTFLEGCSRQFGALASGVSLQQRHFILIKSRVKQSADVELFYTSQLRQFQTGPVVTVCM